MSLCGLQLKIVGSVSQLYKDKNEDILDVTGKFLPIIRNKYTQIFPSTHKHILFKNGFCFKYFPHLIQAVKIWDKGVIDKEDGKGKIRKKEKKRAKGKAKNCTKLCS